MPTIQTNRAEIYYKDYRRDAANIPPLLLIHGAGGMYLDWPIQLRRATHSLALDLPGHGRSPLPGRQSIAAYAKDIIALLDALELDTIVAAGHSMGGAIAQTLALAHPERVTGLILVATGATLPVNAKIIHGMQTDLDATADLLMKWMWSKEAPQSYRDKGKERLLEIPPQVIHDDYVACNQFDSYAQLPQITQPTLVVAADTDKMTPLTWNQQLADRIPQAKMAVIHGAGHMLTLEQPQQVTDVITRWLDNYPSD